MKKIRKGVFETNSSSTHSICITKNDVLDEKRNWISFQTGEFGWECDTLTTLSEKASYLYTAILYNEKLDLLDKVKEILDTNNIEYEFEEANDRYSYYIDHSSMLNEFLNDICNNEDKLMRFLFSSESFILTGNDNDDYDVEINVSYEHEEYYKGN